MNRSSFLATLFFGIFIYNNALSQDVRSQLRQIANDLAKQIEAKGKKRVAVASFLDLQNQETELGRYMADKFSLGLSNSPNLEVLDRSQLAQLMEENKFGAKSILDPKTIPTLGKIAGVDVFITGNYAPLDNSIDLTVKIIDSQRAVRLGGTDGVIPRTPEVNKLLSSVGGIGINNTNNSSNTSNTPKVRTEIKPAPDCGTKNSCVICLTNGSSINVKGLNQHMWSYAAYNVFYIHPGETKCWKEVYIQQKQDHMNHQIWFRNDNDVELKTEQFVIEPCKVYTKTYTD
ncbi:FlgO family outer membrane protein [Spirosoma foliorum]|uniref:FlgO domain-containing protein n=1 Tax=Spirosoma foliorum TaxID=2710596 RepID=A0A7G5GS74_9BACT|nr:FlgO family outer membrane protein [Spirosoma foliorum]QMW01716.1 hypothetical protein H3H32_27765 [Spirosoma foliorum]